MVPQLRVLGPDTVDCNYTVRCRTTYEYVFVYTRHVFLLLLLLLLCVAILLAAAAVVLIIGAAVLHRAPGGKNCCWFIQFDPSAFFLSIQTRFIFDVPIGSTVSYLRLDLPTSLVLTGMRGAKASVSPPRRGPLVLYA